MYWFVIYAARSRNRARVKAPLAGPPQIGSWLSCGSPRAGDRSIARYTAILAEREWAELCDEQRLDFRQACREEGVCTVCEAGPLPVLFVEQEPAGLPGIEALTGDMRKCVAGPLAAIALEMPSSPGARGVASRLEVGLCVAPLSESDVETEQVRSLFAKVALNVGGAEAELHCPDCASPELRWLGGPVMEEQMGCGNCGARFSRAAAYLRLGDCEGILSPGLAAAAAVGTPAPCADEIHPAAPGAKAPAPIRPSRRQP
jgi:hypothetical protein